MIVVFALGISPRLMQERLESKLHSQRSQTVASHQPVPRNLSVFKNTENSGNLFGPEPMETTDKRVQRVSSKGQELRCQTHQLRGHSDQLDETTGEIMSD